MNTKDLFFNSKEFQNIINGQENMFNNKISNINDSDLVDKLKKIHNARLSGSKNHIKLYIQYSLI